MKLSNSQARRVVIHCSGLRQDKQSVCGRNELHRLITFLGYVQQDPIRVVARAHDHILWSRNSRYRIGDMDALLKKERTLYEHFSHDACVLPIETLPYWRMQFERKAASKQFQRAGSLLSPGRQKDMLDRIEREGPLCSKDFNNSDKEAGRPRASWTKPVHKRTLDYLWLSGVLAVSGRENFIKYYDLAERFFSKRLLAVHKSDDQCIDWLARRALERLGFATRTEITAFWEAFTLAETQQWCERNVGTLMDVSVESASGEYKEAFARKAQDLVAALSTTPSRRLKILNPFDPLIRDRKRLLRLFGFDYRIEMYVPPAKRRYGYYVYPMLEFDTFVGRLEIRHDRDTNVLRVDNVWAEPGVVFGKTRMAKLNRELMRLMRFCGADAVQWSS